MICENREVYKPAQADKTKQHRLSAHTAEMCFLTVPEARKSQTKVPTYSGYSESSCLGLQTGLPPCILTPYLSFLL